MGVDNFAINTFKCFMTSEVSRDYERPRITSFSRWDTRERKLSRHDYKAPKVRSGNVAGHGSNRLTMLARAELTAKHLQHFATQMHLITIGLSAAVLTVLVEYTACGDGEKGQATIITRCDAML